MIKLNKYIHTSLSFDILKECIKSRLGIKYKLGIIDKEQISVYFQKDAYTENGLDRVPFCKIRIKRGDHENGKLTIRFSVARFALIPIGLLPLILAVFFYFLQEPFPIMYILGVYYPLVYFILLVQFSNQSDKFIQELREIEADASV